jgi:phospholipase C
LRIIHKLATEFAICDQWFSSMPGPTWPNRFFVHGASSSGFDHSPSTIETVEWETVSGFTYPNGSIYDRLAKDNIQYRLYSDNNNIFTDNPELGNVSGAFPQVSSLKGIFLWDVHSLSNFAEDLKSPYPYAYTFIEPNYGNLLGESYQGGSSQHPKDDMFGGEALLKAVYEAVRNLPLWYSSMIIITYDEHGGFYDSACPGKVTAPGKGDMSSLNKNCFTFEQLGVRVPAVVISPYIAKGTVDHTVYDHTSVLATLEQMWGIEHLTDRDHAATGVQYLLNTNARPRTDCPTTLGKPVATKSPAERKVRLAAAKEVEDLPLPKSGNLIGSLVIAAKARADMAVSDAAKQQVRDEVAQIKTQGQAERFMAKTMQLAADASKR